MTNFDGNLFTIPNYLFGVAGIDGYLTILPSILFGDLSDSGIVWQTSITACPPLPVTYFALSMFDNTGTRHYWTDTNISVDNAPSGPTYNVSTFAIEGLF